jgi:hypothetical protein
MKKEQLKILVREVLKEMVYSRRSSSSDTYEGYDIEFESLIIPGISTENDTVSVLVSIEYDFDPGYEPKGMFGPPECSDPGEGASINVTDYWPTSLRVSNEAGKETEYEPDKLTVDQQEILKKAIEDHMYQNENKIDDMILNTLGF